ncbi:hypothetical protein Tco_0044988 [Tanacetum coccineum]
MAARGAGDVLFWHNVKQGALVYKTPQGGFVFVGQTHGLRGVRSDQVGAFSGWVVPQVTFGGHPGRPLGGGAFGWVTAAKGALVGAVTAQRAVWLGGSHHTATAASSSVRAVHIRCLSVNRSSSSITKASIAWKLSDIKLSPKELRTYAAGSSITIRGILTKELDPKEINEKFPLETLSSIALLMLVPMDCPDCEDSRSCIFIKSSTSSASFWESNEDTSPSEITSEIPMEVEGFKPPHEEEALVHRSLDLESKKWLDAMNAEMQSMKDNQVWRLVDLPPNSIVAFYDYEICQMDVKTAFLNGYLDEDIYMMDNSKRGNIPMQERFDLNKTQGASTPREVKRMQNVPYASAVGSIMYAVRCTRPDVAFANPEAELRVDCYCNAGFETNRDEIKSQTRYIFILNGRRNRLEKPQAKYYYNVRYRI